MPFFVTAKAVHRISLADLGAPATDSSGNRRYVCPLCSTSRRKATRRDLSVNLSSGAWQCWHCGESGKLTDYWTDRPKLSRKEQRRARLREVFSLTPKHAPSPPPDPIDAPWRAWLQNARELAGTPGETYLVGRGIPCDLAHTCGVRYIADWYGRPGVLYPLHDEPGEVQAAGVRYIDGRDNPKTRVAGRLSLGVFATPSALTADSVIVVEGPADALAIASTGRSAVALHRVSAPGWLVKKLAFRRVSVALDADPSGDAGAETLAGELKSYGANATRLRPPEGKDWNDTLQAWGAAQLSDWLASAIPPVTPSPPPPTPRAFIVPDAVHGTPWEPGVCPGCGGPGSPRADGRCYGCITKELGL